MQFYTESMPYLEVQLKYEETLLKIDESEVWTKLIGKFNAVNLLAIFATAELLGIEKLETLFIYFLNINGNRKGWRVDIKPIISVIITFTSVFNLSL